MGNFRTAWKAFWAILGNDDKAKAWEGLGTQTALPAPEQVPEPEHEEEPAPAPIAASDGADAVHLLALLQREARFVDYLQEDLSQYEDGAVGGVSRKVHDDCIKVLRKYLHLAPVLDEAEQSKVEVPAGFDPRRIKVTGRPAGNPPFSGVVQHRGWQVSKVDLPKRNSAQDPTIICPAEVEV